MEPTKRCTKCSETLPIANFYRRNSRPCGYESRCKACARREVVALRATPKGAKLRRKSVKRYAKTDKHRNTNRAYQLRRKDNQGMATPPWSPLLLIADVYREAERLTLESGIKHEVHHIMPIMEFAALFSGLHVPWNLEILTADEHTEAHIELRRVYSKASRSAKSRQKSST